MQSGLHQDPRTALHPALMILTTHTKLTVALCVYGVGCMFLFPQLSNSLALLACLHHHHQQMTPDQLLLQQSRGFCGTVLHIVELVHKGFTCATIQTNCSISTFKFQNQIFRMTFCYTVAKFQRVFRSFFFCLVVLVFHIKDDVILVAVARRSVVGGTLLLLLLFFQRIR